MHDEILGKFDLAVAYRIYPGISKSPAYCSTDKLKLSRFCLQSFQRSLGGLRVKIWALLDGCPPAYEALFREFFPSGLEVLSLEKVGNLATFRLQIDILTRQTDAPLVYLAEDDYFYLPNALAEAVEMMRANRDVDFCTTYDHPDVFDTCFRLERHFVRPTGSRYWRTTGSTPLTFLARRQALIDTASMFLTYSKGNHDCSVWLALTQRASLLNPWIQWPTVARFKIWVKTLIWGSAWIATHRRRNLWVTMPSLATHMESTVLAPGIDWEEQFRLCEELESRSRSLTKPTSS